MGWARRFNDARFPVVVLALLLGACAGGTAGTSAPPAQIRGTFTPAPTHRAGTSTKHAPPQARPGSTLGPGAQHSSGAGAFDDLGSVGAMARAYADATRARRMYVEVAYVDGYAPSQDSLDHLASILKRDLAKPDGVTIRFGAKIPRTRDEWGLADIAALSSRYRTHWSGADTATMWLVSLNGSFSGAQGVLGVAYRASEAALFPEQMRQATTALVNFEAIERSVITHETGHLLGLVNIAATSAYDHEDRQHRGHSKYRTSVMYWAIDDISVAALLGGGPPDDFDQYDRADLVSLREK